MSTFKKNIEEIDNQFFLYLERIMNSYPPYKSNPEIDEYRNIYENDENQLNTLFLQVDGLEQKIRLEIEKNNQIIEKQKNQVNKYRQLFEISLLDLEKIKSENNSSIPRKEDYNRLLYYQYVALFYKSILLGSFGYLFYRLLK